MTIDAPVLLPRGLDFFHQAAAQVTAEDWAAPSPCEQWKAHDVVGHVLGVLGMALDVLANRPITGPIGVQSYAGDPLAAFDARAEEVRAALVDADVGATVDTSLGSRTTDFRLAFPAVDMFLHAWDVSAATGRSIEIPDDVVDDVEAFLRTMPEDQMRSPAAFGPAVPAPDGADRTIRLMAWLGRDVRASQPG
ncbi:MAG: TIGR03086 family metal-binding protein [Nocardioidaceae bacterium]